MNYFGSPNFGDPSMQPRIDPPVGRFCCWCGEPIAASDSGVVTPVALVGTPPAPASTPTDLPYHEACFVRTTVGSVGHQRGACPCFGGQFEDPPGMTLRQAAEAALDETYLQGARRLAVCLSCAHTRRRHHGPCQADGCRCSKFEESQS